MARVIPFLLACAGALVLPLAVLLFLQWPLREWVQAYSREANDLAQIIFACYVAVGVSVASYQGVHLAARAGENSTAARKRWRAAAIPIATALCVGPWAIFMLWSCLPSVMQSVASGERFAETLNPGYFAIRLSMVLMLVCIFGWLLVQLRSAYSSEIGEGP
jgi:TRAP-type C4-dicarboxylate transport system permease small subunit